MKKPKKAPLKGRGQRQLNTVADLKRGGVKYDGEKIRYDLIPPIPMELLALVYTLGAVKYTPWNWYTGMDWWRVFAATMRHLWKFWLGEDNDPETGLPHPIHAAWGCITLTQFCYTHRSWDDRPKAKRYYDSKILDKHYKDAHLLMQKYIENKSKLEKKSKKKSKRR